GAGPCCRRAEYCVEHFASSSKRDRSCFSKQDERKIGRGRSSKTEVNQTQGCYGNASRFRGRIVFKFTTMNPNLTKPGTSKRKAITLTQDALAIERLLRADSSLPLLLEPAVEGVILSQWAVGKTDFISEKLRSNGGILFRGFKVGTVEEFELFLQSLVGDLFHYSYRSTPRTRVSGRIYTSTEYPQHQTIPLHNEMSYSRNWPMVIGFCCLEAPSNGGETPIADSRKVFQAIQPEVRDRFIEKGVMYVRNYGDALDLSWRDVFQTTDQAEVETFCREAGIDFEWKGENQLQT